MIICVCVNVCVCVWPVCRAWSCDWGMCANYIALFCLSLSLSTTASSTLRLINPSPPLHHSYARPLDKITKRARRNEIEKGEGEQGMNDGRGEEGKSRSTSCLTSNWHCVYAHYDRRKETKAMKKTKKGSEVWKEREGEEGEGTWQTSWHLKGGGGLTD